MERKPQFKIGDKVTVSVNSLLKGKEGEVIDVLPDRPVVPWYRVSVNNWVVLVDEKEISKITQ